MKPEEKKHYEAPAVTRVRLTVKESILAVCSSSTTISPLAAEGACDIKVGGCYFQSP